MQNNSLPVSNWIPNIETQKEFRSSDGFVPFPVATGDLTRSIPPPTPTPQSQFLEEVSKKLLAIYSGKVPLNTPPATKKLGTMQLGENWEVLSQETDKLIAPPISLFAEIINPKISIQFNKRGDGSTTNDPIEQGYFLPDEHEYSLCIKIQEFLPNFKGSVQVKFSKNTQETNGCDLVSFETNQEGSCVLEIPSIKLPPQRKVTRKSPKQVPFYVLIHFSHENQAFLVLSTTDKVNLNVSTKKKNSVLVASPSSQPKKKAQETIKKREVKKTRETNNQFDTPRFYNTSNSGRKRTLRTLNFTSYFDVLEDEEDMDADPSVEPKKKQTRQAKKSKTKKTIFVGEMNDFVTRVSNSTKRIGELLNYPVIPNSNENVDQNLVKQTVAEFKQEMETCNEKVKKNQMDSYEVCSILFKQCDGICNKILDHTKATRIEKQ